MRLRNLSMLLTLLVSAAAGPVIAAPPPPVSPAVRPRPPDLKTPDSSKPAEDRPTGDQKAIEGTAKPPVDLPAAPTRLVAVQATLMVKVVHPEEVRRAAIERARAVGGFATLVTDAELHLKVPPEELNATIDGLAASGLVLQKTLQRDDRTEHIAQLEAKLRSKTEILTRLRTFLDDSNVQATLQIERSMTQLVAEVESLRGELTVERSSVQHARVVARFDFHREGRITYVRSPFEWLNTVDLDRFLAEF